MASDTIASISSILRDFEEKGVYLHDYGNITGGGSIYKNDEKRRKEINEYKELSIEARAKTFTIDTIERALEEIPMILDKRVTQNKKVSSYGLKHMLEDYRKQRKVKGDNYISNGEFILAMLLLGYKADFGKDPTVNCTFNCKVIKTQMNSLKEED